MANFGHVGMNPKKEDMQALRRLLGKQVLNTVAEQKGGWLNSHSTLDNMQSIDHRLQKACDCGVFGTFDKLQLGLC